MKSNIQIHTLTWQGIALEIRYIKSWSASFEKTYGHAMAHLEIRTITDAQRALPITETGYLHISSLPMKSKRLAARLAMCRHGWMNPQMIPRGRIPTLQMAKWPYFEPVSAEPKFPAGMPSLV